MRFDGVLGGKEIAKPVQRVVNPSPGSVNRGKDFFSANVSRRLQGLLIAKVTGRPDEELDLDLRNAFSQTSEDGTLLSLPQWFANSLAFDPFFAQITEASNTRGLNARAQVRQLVVMGRHLGLEQALAVDIALEIGLAIEAQQSKTSLELAYQEGVAQRETVEEEVGRAPLFASADVGEDVPENTFLALVYGKLGDLRRVNGQLSRAGLDTARHAATMIAKINADPSAANRLMVMRVTGKDRDKSDAVLRAELLGLLNAAGAELAASDLGAVTIAFERTDVIFTEVMLIDLAVKALGLPTGINYVLGLYSATAYRLAQKLIKKVLWLMRNGQMAPVETLMNRMITHVEVFAIQA